MSLAHDATRTVLSFLAAAAFAAAGTAAAQDLTAKGPPQQRPVVIRGATIHTVARGPVADGTIWFQDGTIRGVHGPDDAPALPPDAEAIDGRGRHVYPGLISAHTAIGLQEIGMVRQSVDLHEVGELTPEALAAVAVNPDSAVLPVTRSNGVLVAGVFPQGGLVPGRVAVIQLDGWTNEDLCVRADAGLLVQWPARAEDSGRMRRRPPADRPPDEGAADTRTEKNRKRIEALFAEAKAWADAAAADPATPRDLRFAAMTRAIRGEAPTFVLADELEQIETAVAWAVRAGLKPVVVGGRDAGLCAALLVRHGVPVVLGGTHPLPRRADSPFSERFELPAMLHGAGVRFCLASGEAFYNERNLPYQAATAVAWGLDPQVALRSVTLDAAEILGVGDRLGSLEAGKDATLMLTDGSPLDLATKIETAFVRGRRIDLRNKQTELARKYRSKYEQPANGR